MSSRVETRPSLYNQSEYHTLPKIPGPERRNQLSDTEKLNTAGHELNHALVALAMGAQVVGISVEPAGNTLGVTSYVGSLSIDQIKMVAVAGSIAAHDGHASGYGSDMQKVHVLRYMHGGISVDSAQELSEKVIASYPLEVREKAAEIIAWMGHVTGSQLQRVLQRAREEVYVEQERIISAPAYEANAIDERSEMGVVTKVGYTGNNEYAYATVLANDAHSFDS